MGVSAEPAPCREVSASDGLAPPLPLVPVTPGPAPASDIPSIPRPILRPTGVASHRETGDKEVEGERRGMTPRSGADIDDRRARGGEGVASPLGGGDDGERGTRPVGTFGLATTGCGSTRSTAQTKVDTSISLRRQFMSHVTERRGVGGPSQTNSTLGRRE